MRKKQLLLQNTQMHALLENERQKSKGLEMKNAEFSTLLKAKEAEIFELNKKLAEAELRYSELVKPSSELSEKTILAEATLEEIQTVRDAEVCPLPQKSLPVTVEMCSSEAEQYGAKAIGRIAVKASILSNLLAASGDENAHDLLTLTLGRTEVFKGEVLSAVRTGQALEQISKTIDRLEADVIDYFDNIKGQLG